MRSGGFRRAGPEAVRGLAEGGEQSGLSVPTHLYNIHPQTHMCTHTEQGRKSRQLVRVP